MGLLVSITGILALFLLNLVLISVGNLNRELEMILIKI